MSRIPDKFWRFQFSGLTDFGTDGSCRDCGSRARTGHDVRQFLKFPETALSPEMEVLPLSKAAPIDRRAEVPKN
jgi:hypothetical protein